MNERRSLVEGLRPQNETDRTKEGEFVYGPNPNTTSQPQAAVGSSPAVPISIPQRTQSRSPVSTRIRSDFAEALRKASLERQLKGEVPNTVQDILEEALEPWLKGHGYLK